jgi:hypothetical protein
VQPDREHRCTATAPASQLALSKQRELCLQPAHFGCATYQAAREVVGDGHAASVDGGLWPETRGAILSLESAGRVRSGPMLVGRGTGQALLVGLMVVAFVVLIIARVAPATGGPGESVAAGAAASSSPGAVSSPVASDPASAAPSPSAAPSGSDQPAASPGASDVPASEAPSGAAASAGPSAEPSASGVATTYRVKRGDTLSGIAAQFGTTVRKLMAANGITNATMIHPGQVLVIPD